MARKIIFDTDPGQDDAIALLTALGSPELEILGIVTVAGNIPLALTTANALRILELAERAEIPVHAGSDRPLGRALVTAEHIHGESGLDGPHLPVPSIAARASHGVDFLVETIRAEPPDSVTLLCLGPLTNVALALMRAPDLADRLGAIVLMGGGRREGGNITPAAEFNMYVDPVAAGIVFRSGAAITVVPLDVTHWVRATPERVAAFAGLGNRSGAAVAAMLSFSERFDLEKYGWEGAPVHDPCVPAFVLSPGLFSGRRVHVEIETSSPLTLGMSVVDYWRVTGAAPNALWLDEVDAAGVFALMTERVGRLP